MESPRYRRRTAAFVLMGVLVAGLAACTEEGRPEGLPTDRPSADISTGERTGRPTPTETENTARTEDPEPTRTRETRTVDPTRTEEPTEEPTRTEEPTQEPTRTQDPTQEPTRTEEPTREPTQAPEPTKAATTSTSAAAVAVSNEDDGDAGSGAWGWLLLLLLFTGLAAVLLVGRSRRVTSWDAEARGLAGETRTVLDVRMPPVLTTPDPTHRGLVWPPVRDELGSLEARWAAHLERTPDGDRQAYASQVTEMLRDLVNAVDAQNEAMATGRDWRLVRPRPEAVIEALHAALAPEPVPAAAYPVTEPGPPSAGAYPATEPGPPPAAGTYPVTEPGPPPAAPPSWDSGRPPGPPHTPRHEAPDDGTGP